MQFHSEEFLNLRAERGRKERTWLGARGPMTFKTEIDCYLFLTRSGSGAITVLGTTTTR